MRLVALLIACFLALPLAAQRSAWPAGTEELAYGQHARQRLDFIPAATSHRAPLFIFIHGGAWAFGDKGMAGHMAAHARAQGYAFASLGYRLVPDADPGEQAADVAAAIAYLVRNADELGIDPDRIIVSGHSAGAHLAALVGTDPRYLAAHRLPVSILDGVVLLDGAGYDVPAQMARGGPFLRRLYARAFGEDSAFQARVSPTRHAAAPNAGRFLILHIAGRADDSGAQSQGLAAALRRAGTPAEVVSVEGPTPRFSACSAGPAMLRPNGRTPLHGTCSPAKSSRMSQPGFTGAGLDRADHLRLDAERLADLMANGDARLLQLDIVDPVLDEAGALRWGPVEGAKDLLFLGLEEGRPLFAPLVRMELGQRAWSVFSLLALMSPRDAAIWGAARSLNEWHNRHGFCSVCGHATAPFRAGWGRHCPACNAEHFPRVDPVVIMLAEHEGRVLLGRSPHYPPRRYSALAGFVEPAESIEEAVARELLEEAGVAVTDVRYVASQPWPFPGSLMIACIGKAASDALTLDGNELEDAFWCDRAGVLAALAGDRDAPFQAPPPLAIANTLLTRWSDGG